MVRLPRLQPGVALVDKDGKPTRAFVSFWNTAANAIEQQEAAQEVTLASLQEQIDRLNASLRSTSHADGLLITAEANGATAKIVITNHTRTYTDLAVSVTGGTLTGLAYGSTYSVYYDDEPRTGGAVTLVATLTPADAVTSAAHPNRHLVGVVTTPATSGDPPTDGGGSLPPGFPSRDEYPYETP